MYTKYNLLSLNKRNPIKAFVASHLQSPRWIPSGHTESYVSVTALKTLAGRFTFAFYWPQDAGSDAVDGALTPPAETTDEVANIQISTINQ